jgi:NitT/TauT family transport system ATP-binding protein
MLSLSEIGKIFDNGTEALRGLNLDIAEGSFSSLLGPSGCGKSTILRIIAGLEKPSSGEISWLASGLDGSKSPEISFVFQEPTLMPWASVHDNVWFPLRLKGLSRKDAQERVDEALELVGLSGFSGAYPRELSGGMRMRASIARALVTRPKLLLLDEPFAALDEITRFKLNDDLLRLWRTLDWTVLFVTHSVFESVYLSNRIVVMSERPGRVVDDIVVEAAYPRSETFRTSKAYNAYCRKTSEMLRAAMDA